MLRCRGYPIRMTQALRYVQKDEKVTTVAFVTLLFRGDVTFPTDPSTLIREGIIPCVRSNEYLCLEHLIAEVLASLRGGVC